MKQEDKKTAIITGSDRGVGKETDNSSVLDIKCDVSVDYQMESLHY